MPPSTVAARKAHRKSADPVRPGAKRRVLVVEDYEDLAESTARLLALHGFCVETADNGQGALRLAQSFQPDFVILDIDLPGMNGYEVSRRLRADDELQGTVIVVVSAYGPDVHPHRAQVAGFDHHLVKPVDFNDLLPLLQAGPR